MKIKVSGYFYEINKYNQLVVFLDIASALKLYKIVEGFAGHSPFSAYWSDVVNDPYKLTPKLKISLTPAQSKIHTVFASIGRSVNTFCDFDVSVSTYNFVKDSNRCQGWKCSYNNLKESTRPEEVNKELIDEFRMIYKVRLDQADLRQNAQADDSSTSSSNASS